MESKNLSPQDSSIPIAIVGMAGKFPGEATDPEKFWDMLRRGKSALSKVPADRFNIDAFYHPSPEHQGSTNAQSGNFLQQDISSFDAPFFSITPKEAQAMDPQQRLALEVAYEGLENAGMSIHAVSGSSMACYMAVFTKDYATLRGHDSEEFPVYDFTGNAISMISNRISWFFNLRGPSISLDTACSSSLVALHLACQSLRSGEAASAIVGGTNAILMPELQTAMSSLHFLSPDCKSMAFDHKANGYARGEGAAVVILKPLLDALRDGNVIRAVIRGSGVNQDGRTPGITVPSFKAQKELIEATYANAGLSFEETLYVEAHGTGTAVGDPIECAAIGSTIGQYRTSESPLLVGSAKTNIGHLESAAGLAGLIKTVYILEKGQIPPSLWFEKANPNIPFQNLRLKVATELQPWPVRGLRRASVNSFGYGGTNAHCILDDALHYLDLRGLEGFHNTIRDCRPTNGQLLKHEDDSPVTNGNARSQVGYTKDYPTALTNGDRQPCVSRLERLRTQQTLKPRLLIWSSHDEQGIERTAKSLASYVKTRDQKPEEENDLIERLAFTLAATRHEFSWRSFVVAANFKETCSALEKQPSPVSKMKRPVIAFIFTGQGAQWFAMGRELLVYDVFHDSLKAAAAYFKVWGSDWDLIDELLADEHKSRINEAVLSHPASASLQVALVDLLTSWGVKPSVVIGHSSGEVAAAYARRAITRESVWKVAYHRGRLASAVRREGGMLAVGLGEDEAKAIIDENEVDGIVVACINSPMSVTLSGDIAAILRVKALLDEGKVFSRRLAVTTAYHSPHMNDIAQEYSEALGELTSVHPLEEDNVQMFSSVTGELIAPSTLAQSSHWVSNMLRPVKFLQAIEAALSYRPDDKSTRREGEGFNLMLEIGPHSALQMPLKQILAAKGKENAVKYTTMLTRKHDATRTTLNAMGYLFQYGYGVNIHKVNRPLDADDCGPVPLVDMPPYAWNHDHKYWSESAICHAFRTRKYPRHDLLGYQDEHSTSQEPSWRNFVRVSELPWLEHHRVQSTILYPFSGMIIMAIEAVRQLDDGAREMQGFHLRNVSVDTAMIITNDVAVETKVQLRPWRKDESSWKRFSVFSRNQHGVWTQHCQGFISVSYRSSASNDEMAAWHRHEAAELKNRGLDAKNTAELYHSWNELGLQWTESFQSIVQLSSGNYEAQFIIQVPDTKAYMPEEFQHDHVIHPTTLDGVLQTILPACTTREKPLSKGQVPRFVQGAYVSHQMMTKLPGDELHGYSRFDPSRSEGTILAFDQGWNTILVCFEGIKLAGISQEANMSDATEQNLSSTWVLEWGLDIEALSDESLEQFLRSSMDAVPEATKAVIHDLELASFIICKRILRLFSVEKARLFAPHHSSFFDYIQRQYSLAKEGKLVCQPALDTSDDWLHLKDETEDVVLDRAFTTSIDGRLLSRVADSLVQVLEGELEPLQVLRQDDMLTEYYRSCIGIDKIYAGLCHFITNLSHKKPLRILEVGAGTGGTTLAVLSAFGSDREAASSRIQQYSYTDISSGFFEDAAKTLDGYSQLIDYSVLDIEKDPASQGFESGSYDLVLATKVLHACCSIERCLHHCRKLLKPDGYLALVELTSTTARTPMIFGILNGWWFGEKDDRKWGPRLSEEQWDSHLRKQGFENGLSVSIRDDGRDCFSHTLMISRACCYPAMFHEKPSCNIFIVQAAGQEENDESTSCRLAQAITHEGFQVQQVSVTDIPKYHLRDKLCVVTLEVDGPFLQDASETQFSTIKKLLLDSASTLWLIKGASMNCGNPEANLITGLASIIRKEYPETRLTILHLDDTEAADGEATWSAVAQMLRSPSSGDERETEKALRNGNFYVPRFHRQEISKSGIIYNSLEESENAFVLKRQRPDIHFTECNEFPLALGPKDVEIKVKAVELSQRQVKDQNQDSGLVALQCSGIVSRIGQGVTQIKKGDRVLTYRPDACRTHVRNAEHLVHKIPDSMSFEKAASLLFTYMAAHYALQDIGHLQAGEKVLIYATTREIAEAAIVFSRHMGAETLVAVSKPGLKQLLVESTGLSEHRVFCSFQHGLAAEICNMTGGKGVDFILSTSRGQPLGNVVHCIQPFSRFVEVGSMGELIPRYGDMDKLESPHTRVESESSNVTLFSNSVVFASVNMESLASTKSPLLRHTVSKVMEYLDVGIITIPEPFKVIPFSQCDEALDILQDEKRLILSTNDNDGLLPVIPAKHRPLMLVPDATYMICIGQDKVCFAAPLISFMASKGATHTILVKTSGDDDESLELLNQMHNVGLNARLINCDLSNASDFQQALNDLNRFWPPIQGMILLLDSPAEQPTSFEDLSTKHFQMRVNPIIKATRNLHEFLPKALDFFIILSYSMVGVIGSKGHGCHEAAYGFQSCMMRHRQAMGLAGTCMAFESTYNQHFSSESSVGISAIDLLAAVEMVMKSSEFPPEVIIYTENENGEEASFLNETRYTFIRAKSDHQQDGWQSPIMNSTRSTACELGAELSTVQTTREAMAIILSRLVSKLARLIMVDEEEIDPERSASSYHIDSLMAIEIRIWVLKLVRSDVSVFEILSNEPLVELASRVTARSSLVPEQLRL